MSRKLTCMAALCLAVAMAGSAGAQDPNDKVLFDYWFDVPGTTIADLTSLGSFPWGPDQSEYLPDLKSPADWKDNYGLRARAYLVPPESGDYTFWVAGDDQCQLWLSTNEDPANKVLIARVASWTAVEEWTKEAGQKSAPIALEAGQMYYVEGLLKEGGGGDSWTAAWAGPGIGDAPTVIRGDYLVQFVETRHPAYSPDPANGATDITNPLLTWTAGKTAVTQNVYFGTNPVPGPNDLVATQPAAMSMYYHLAGLEPGVTYYWRVDEVDADGVISEGDVWSFTSMPMTAHFPNPYDGALWRQTDITASWTPGQTAVSHMVYASTDEALVAAGDPNALLATIEEPMIDATGFLVPGARYFWRVDEVDAAGTVFPGDVWTFTTYDPNGGALAEYWDNMTLSGDPKVVKIVPEINFEWGDGPVQGVNSPDVNIPTNNFSCRWTAALNVPVTGTYTLYDASDDGARLFLNGVQLTNGWSDRGTTEDASEALELVAGERYVVVMEMYENGGGAAAFLRWSGPDIPKEIIPQGALQLVTWATSPEPANGAEGLGDTPELSWVAGERAATHDVYLSSDEAKVAAGDASVLVSQQAETSYVPAALNWNTTYYWKVDEVAEDGTVVPGDVWSFSIADYIPVIDGAVTVDYDNTVEPYITELVQEYAAPQDWTKNGVTSLQLELTGGEPKFAIDDGMVTLTGAGADVYMGTEEFRFLYKQLDGDGSITVEVNDVNAINTWTKAGIMVRGSLDQFAASVDIISAAQQSLIEWMHRDEPNSTTTSALSTAAESSPLPIWLRITRAGDEFTSEYSLDAGETWNLVVSADETASSVVTLAMPSTVYVGMLMCSHVAGTLTSAQFTDVELTGNVSADWAVADIGVAQANNDPAPVYVALTDAAGNTATVNHPDNPNVTIDPGSSAWKILLSSFSGVDLKSVVKVAIGVGDGQPDGTGSIEVADVRVVKPFAIDVVNPSFEQPNKSANQLLPPPAIRFTSVPGWSTDSEPKYSCVTKQAKPSKGSWAAFLAGGDPSIWQVTDHVVVEGEAFQLDVDSAVVVGAVRDDKGNLKISLFYVNDAGKRVSLGSSSFAMPTRVKNYSLSISADQAHPAAGHQLGIEIANIRDNGIGVDNVRLKTK